MVDPGDHVRPTDGGHDPGVYRVVGTGEEVALLRVTDADGRRAHTGEVIHVPADALRSTFESADDPGGRSPVATLVDRLRALLGGSG